MIEINHVTKAFGDKTVLDNVTVTIADGSIYGLVGYNGAGKTTLLNLIAGLYRPDGGNITADTEDGKLAVYGSEQVRRDLFLIPDDPYILPQASLATMAAFYRGFYPHFSMETMEKLNAALEQFDPEFLSVYYGEDAEEDGGEKTVAYLSKAFPDAEVSLINGGQPVYYYMISAE